MKTSRVYIIASICFCLAGIIEIISNQFQLGFSFLALGFTFLVLSMTYMKNQNSKDDVKIDKLDILTKDDELMKLISADKKIAAMRRCRKITGCDLMAAEEYVKRLKYHK